ncbi:hypothetical protein D3C77_692010 [compost metagenome]
MRFNQVPYSNLLHQLCAAVLLRDPQVGVFAAIRFIAGRADHGELPTYNADVRHCCTYSLFSPWANTNGHHRSLAVDATAAS